MSVARAAAPLLLPLLLLPLLGDPVDMAEILAVRRVTLSSSSSIGGVALIFFVFLIEVFLVLSLISLASNWSLHARKHGGGFKMEHSEQAAREEAQRKQEKDRERVRKEKREFETYDAEQKISKVIRKKGTIAFFFAFRRERRLDRDAASVS